MSMTREEARKHLEELFEYCENMKVDGEIQTWERDCEAIEMAISALRPVSRERVEKAWRGEWKGVPKLGVYDMACSKCGYSPGIRFYSSEFCPNCGAPMTDEAVDMVMERMEAVKDEAETN